MRREERAAIYHGGAVHRVDGRPTENRRDRRNERNEREESSSELHIAGCQTCWSDLPSTPQSTHPLYEFLETKLFGNRFHTTYISMVQRPRNQRCGSFSAPQFNFPLKLHHRLISLLTPSRPACRVCWAKHVSAANSGTWHGRDVPPNITADGSRTLM